MPEPQISAAAATLGREGGKKKVAKGFAKMDPARLKRISSKAVKKRWRKVQPK